MGLLTWSRETVLSSLHDEALTENELVDHANPMAEASKRVMEAGSPEEAAQIGREAVADLKDTEMTNLVRINSILSTLML